MTAMIARPTIVPTTANNGLGVYWYWMLVLCCCARTKNAEIMQSSCLLRTRYVDFWLILLVCNPSPSQARTPNHPAQLRSGQGESIAQHRIDANTAPPYDSPFRIPKGPRSTPGGWSVS